MAGGVPEFACTSCGKSYKWKSEFAGRRVKCKCGFEMIAPAEEPPVTLAEEEDDLYALADDKPAGQPAPAPVRQRVAPMPAAPASAVAPAVALPRPPVLGYMGTGRTRRDDEGRPRGGDDINDPLRDFILPTTLLGVGFALAVLDYMHFSEHLPLKYALPVVSVLLIFELTIMVIGSLMMVKLMDLGFGPVGTGLLKLAAIAVGPGAVCAILGDLIGGGGIFLTMSISIVMYWALFWYFFDMDFSEMMYLIMIVWVIRTWAQYLIIAMLLSVFAAGLGRMGGGSGAGTGAGGGTGTSITAPGGGGGEEDAEE